MGLLRHAVVVVALLASGVIIGAQQQPALTNSDIVKMVKASMPGDVIAMLIRQRSTAFDTSVDGLIALKKEGVPDSIISEMVARSSKPTSAARSPNDTAKVGVALLNGSTRVPLYKAVATDGTSGVPPYTAIRSFKRFDGVNAPIQVATAVPSFEVALPSEANPNEAIVLVKLEVKANRREVQVGSGRFNMSLEIDKRSRIPISAESAPGRESEPGYVSFRVTPTKPLPVGQYAIVIVGTTALGALGSAHGLTFYDFGFDGK